MDMTASKIKIIEELPFYDENTYLKIYPNYERGCSRYLSRIKPEDARVISHLMDYLPDNGITKIYAELYPVETREYWSISIIASVPDGKTGVKILNEITHGKLQEKIKLIKSVEYESPWFDLDRKNTVTLYPKDERATKIHLSIVAKETLEKMIT